MSDKVNVIIVAAGNGSRFGGEMPKQFRILDGIPVLFHSIMKYRETLPEAEIRLVLNREMFTLWERICDEYGFVSPVVIEGGTNRSESVRNALISFSDDHESIVLIHDGVRPLIDSKIIKSVIGSVSSGIGVAPAIPESDSIRQITSDGSSHSADRNLFRRVQTPQGFMTYEIIRAYCSAPACATDDLTVFENTGGIIKLVEGSTSNIKITYPEDLEIAEILIKR